MSARSEWRSNLTRLRRSYHARLGAFGAVFAIAIAACEPQCAPAPAPAPAPGPAPAAAPPPAPPGGGGAQVPAPTGGQFYEDFSSPDSVGRFDVQLHSGTTGTELQPLEPSWQGDHNHACEGPETKRTIFGGDVRQLDPRSLTWYCAPRGAESGHFMTSVDTGSVVVLGFSPNQVFSNISQVCWDVNATNLGEGKWINMVVVPESVFQANGRRLDYSSDPDLDPSSLRLPSQSLLIKEFRGAIISAWNGYNQTMWEGGPDDITDDPAARYTSCVQDLGNGSMRVTVERPSGRTDTWVRDGGFPDGQVRVMFQDGSYNPSKHNAPPGNPLTWHWDNIAVA